MVVDLADYGLDWKQATVEKKAKMEPAMQRREPL